MNKPLPSIKQPEYSLTLPIRGEKITYRPYNVGDERLLITAAAAREDDKEFYLVNTLKVIQDTVLSDINVKTLAAVEVRYILLNQRARSVGEELEFYYKKQRITANINDFRIANIRTKKEKQIDIGDGIGLLLKELSFEDELNVALTTKENDKRSQAEALYKMIAACVDSIYTAEDVWKVGVDITREDAEKFIGDIRSEHSKKLYEFVSNPPVLEVDVIINGEKVTISGKEVDFLDSASSTSRSQITTDSPTD